MADWDHAWTRARAGGYWTSPTYEDNIFAPGRPTALDPLAAVSDAPEDLIRDREPGRFLTRCPAHDDDTASLSIQISEERVLLHCFAGCETERVLDELGLTWKDVM